MIEFKNISKTYTTGTVEVKAVDGVSLRIVSGEFVAFMGASGSGKSTLMHMMGLLDRPDAGTYLLAGRDVTNLSDDQLAAVRNRSIGFVFQQFHLLARMTALENVGLPLVYAGRQGSQDKVRQELKGVGLADRVLHRPNELSGGQQQRVAIARALVNDPFIIMADEPTGNLDTKSKDEIIAILKDLNAKGKTIVMVTHETEMAAHATRVIQMRDGKIISDEKKSASSGLSPDSARLQSALKEALTEEHRSYDFVKILDSVYQATRSMAAHKMRSLLSILGILIGVGAVIAMLALGRGAQEAIQTQLASLGSNLLVVRSGHSYSGGVALQSGSVTRLTLKDLAAVGQLPDVLRVSPAVNGRVQVVGAGKNASTQVSGTGVLYAPMRASVPAAGRFFNDEEYKSRAKVAVIGTTVAQALFGNADPVGEMMRINQVNFRVIGLLPAKSANSFQDENDVVITPATTAMYRLLGKIYIDSIFVEGVSPGVLEPLQEEIVAVLLKRHGMPDTAAARELFQVRNMADVKAAMETTTKTMSMLLGAIAAISLLVGGIGIMNIMLVSVTERTREIGLRKAIGACRRDIMTQFLVESVLMSLIGGLAGIVLGVGSSLLLTFFAGWAVKISLVSVVLSVVFSTAIGLIFGLWPAFQASKMNPIKALRYE